MTWSKDLPNEEGWYWLRVSNHFTDMIPQIVQITYAFGGGFQVNMLYAVPFALGTLTGSEWSGPIKAPESLCGNVCVNDLYDLLKLQGKRISELEATIKDHLMVQKGE